MSTTHAISALAVTLLACQSAMAQLPVAGTDTSKGHPLFSLGDSKCVTVHEMIRCAPVILPSE
jgi:hypothetical protein